VFLTFACDFLNGEASNPQPAGNFSRYPISQSEAGGDSAFAAA
jgi:hypothetical protein